MGSSEFQKELISYLEDENNKLRNKVSHMKENLEKVLTRDSSKNILESVVEEVMNVCTAMTEEIEDLYEHFSATSAALCTVLKRKSQMVQLTKKLSELHSVEQIDPELELIEANNMACFAKRLSDGKNNKRGTAKVSPMIKGHVILTAPRIHLNRVNQDASIRHRIVSESPRLSPVVEMSPAITPPRNQRHLFFREIQIPLQRLNINSDGQVVNRNAEDSPRTTVVKKQPKVPASRLALRSSEPALRNSETLDTTDPMEEENEEVARDEEKENLSTVRGVDTVNETTAREENSELCEDENNEEECSPDSSTQSPDSNNGKDKSFSSPEEAVDPLEGPSWLLDGRPNRRRSSTKSSNFNFVNVRRKRNPFFSVDNQEPAEKSPTSELKLDPVIEQEEPDESEKSEKNCKDNKKNDVSMNDCVDTSDMEMTETLPEKLKKHGKDKKNIVLMNDSADTSDMEMTECIPVVRREIINPANKSLHSVEKVSSSILESSVEINASVLRTSDQPSLAVTERQCIGESSEEEEPDNISSISTPGSEKSRTENSSASPENSRDLRNVPEMGTLELVLEKIDARLSASPEVSPKNVFPKNSTNDNNNKNKNSPKRGASEVKSNSESDIQSPGSPETRIEPPNNLCLTPGNTGRPKRGAALRCMEQKVWIVNTPEDKKKKNRNKSSNNSNNNVNNSNNKNNNKTKRKQDNDNGISPNEKKQKKRLCSVKNKEEESVFDSESDSSSRDSFPTPSIPKRKNPKTNVQNDETKPNQNNRNTVSRHKDAESKNKRKGAPTSIIELSMNESNRTNDQTTINGSCMLLEEEGRKRRKAAPGSLKEPSLNAKLRRNQ